MKVKRRTERKGTIKKERIAGNMEIERLRKREIKVNNITKEKERG